MVDWLTDWAVIVAGAGQQTRIRDTHCPLVKLQTIGDIVRNGLSLALMQIVLCWSVDNIIIPLKTIGRPTDMATKFVLVPVISTSLITGEEVGGSLCGIFHNELVGEPTRGASAVSSRWESTERRAPIRVPGSIESEC